MPLNDTMIPSLKPKPAAYKVADEKGLFLLVTPAGGKLWRLKFRNSMGVEKKLALGAYPDLKLKDAREARDKARSGLATPMVRNLIEAGFRVSVFDSNPHA